MIDLFFIEYRLFLCKIQCSDRQTDFDYTIEKFVVLLIDNNQCYYPYCRHIFPDD